MHTSFIIKDSVIMNRFVEVILTFDEIMGYNGVGWCVYWLLFVGCFIVLRGEQASIVLVR